MNPAQLPTEEQEKLRSLYNESNRDELKAYIASLRAQKWPLRAIGDTLGVSRSTVQYWERSADSKATPATPLSPKAIETAGVRTVKWRTRVPPADREPITALAASARKVRSQTSPNSQLRKDAELLDQLLQANLDRMVSATELAQLMGVTHRAVKARLERKT